MKICKKCGISKNILEFQGNRNSCKVCNSSSNYKNAKNRHQEYTGTKKCNSCICEKDISEFRAQRNMCKKCENKKTYESRKDKQYINNKEYLKLYFLENKEEINCRLREYKKNRKKHDILYRLSISISRLVRESIKLYSCSKKDKKTTDILGITNEEFRIYLESKFEPWMNWTNYGKYNGMVNFGWDIDHIIPLSSAKSVDELYQLNHYTNLQPLCSYTNRYIKRDKI